MWSGRYSSFWRILLPPSSGLRSTITFLPWRWKRQVPQKYSQISTRPHGIIPKYTVIFTAIHENLKSRCTSVLAQNIHGCMISEIQIQFNLYCNPVGMRYHSWLRHYATSQKVTGSSPDEVPGIFNWSNRSSLTMALGWTQPLTEMSTRNLPGGKRRPALLWDDCPEKMLKSLRPVTGIALAFFFVTSTVITHH
jgi:hypothetical protein